MREQEVRELYEAYMQVHQPQEEVEQLNEEAPERITKDAENPLLMKNAGRARLHNPKKVDEETDLFDTILEYLVVEGYADTNEAATAIMANMSEEWRESIVESIDLHEKLRKGTKGKISFTTGKDSNHNQAMTETNPRTGRQRGTSPELKAMGAHGRARRAQHDAEQSGDTEGAQRHAQRRGRLAHVVYNKTNRIIDRADND